MPASSMPIALHLPLTHISRSIIFILCVCVICVLQGCEVQFDTSTDVRPDQPPGNGTQGPSKPHQKKALVYTETQGYQHGVIDKAHNALRSEATKHGWQLTRSDNHFSEERLTDYSVVIFFFTTTNGGEILRADEKRALEDFIANGGGFVGVHSAADTYKHGRWPFYTELLGAEFKSHPNIQEATVRFENRQHPSTKHFKSDQWNLWDEWYNYDFAYSAPRSELTVLATVDENTYSGGENGNDHPIIWCHEYKGGRSWYSGLGHVDSNWDNSDFLLHIIGGMEWAGSFSS